MKVRKVTVEHGGHPVSFKLSWELVKLILQGVGPCEGRQQYGGSQAQLIGSNLHVGMAVGVLTSAIPTAISSNTRLADSPYRGCVADCVWARCVQAKGTISTGLARI